MRLKQPSFAGGILSPQLLGRSDQQSYASGLRTCANAWITRYGTVENRPGTQYVGQTNLVSQRARIVPFTPASGVAFLLEFGQGYIRPWKQGALISVVGAAAYNAGTTYAVGDLVTYSGVIYWSRVDGNLANTPATSLTQWFAQSGGYLTLPTSILLASLSVFQFVQQNDIMTVVAQAFAPFQILHYTDTRWVIQAFTQSTGIEPPTGVSAVATGTPIASPSTPGAPLAVGGTAQPSTASYRIAAYTATAQGVPTAATSVGGGINATAGFPITVSWTGSTGAPIGYAIYKSDTGVGGTHSIIALVGSATFSWVDSAAISQAPPIATAPLGSTGSTQLGYVVTSVDANGVESLAGTEVLCLVGTFDAAHPVTVMWTPVTGAVKYFVYREYAGQLGYIGQAAIGTFSDINYLPDTSKKPPTAISLFSTSNDYPAVVGFYQQRLIFANTLNQPQTVQMSRIGSYRNFTVGTPVTDSDAVSFTIAGKEVTDIRAAVDLGKLILHTSNAEYIVTGNGAGIITPSSVGVTNTGTSGSQNISPVVLGNTDLFVQQGATRINDLKYDVQAFTFVGKDLTKRAADLFRGRSIVEMAWQKVPHSIVWCVLDNGTLLGMTYVPDEDLLAWHSHTTTVGAFESIAVVTENAQYVVYVVVNRTINGSTVRTIERLANRDCLDSVFFTDSVFVDAALTYDGRNTGSTTMTLSGGTTWGPTELLTITASAGTFSAVDVGNQVVWQQRSATTGLVTDLVSVRIASYTSATVVQGYALRIVPTWARAVALTTWGKAVKSFTGIGHLEGQALSVLADGNVAADALNPGIAAVTVSGGAFTLTQPAMVVTAGLPMQTDVQTLPVENATGESIMDRRITVRRCTPNFYASRGGRFGQDFSHLNEWKQPANPPANAQTLGYPQQGYTGPWEVPINGTPSPTGQVAIRHTEPTPFAMSAVLIAGEIGS